MNKIVVSIKCLVYNHGPYLKKCLDGFIMQKTNFRFEVIVHDDASTDNSVDIIQEYEQKYPDIIKPIYETENLYYKNFELISLKINEAIKGDYIAICEGDDYWTDPLKLQKEVDFLEKNPDYGMVFGKVREFIQTKRFFGKTFGSPVLDINKLLLSNTIPTPTVLYRYGLYMQYKKDIDSSSWLLGDYPLWLYITLHSKVHFINEVLAVYRILPDSASHSSSMSKRERFIYSVFDMKLFFHNKYGLLSTEEIISQKFYTLMTNAIIYGKRNIALKFYKNIPNKTLQARVKYCICLFSPLFSLFRYRYK